MSSTWVRRSMFESCKTQIISIPNCSLLLAGLHRNRSTNWTSSLPAGSPEALLTAFDVHQLVELYIISLLILVGSVGNIVSIVVLRKDRERRDALFLLQSLAVADVMYLVVSIFRYPVKYLVPDQDQWVAIQPTVFPMLKTCQTVTIWSMVLVTIDRYVCVCRPLQAARAFNPATRRRYAIAVFVGGLLYNLPRYADSCVYTWYNTCTHESFSRMLYRESFSNPYYHNLYIDGLYITMLYLAPLSILISMNCCLVRAIRQVHIVFFHIFFHVLITAWNLS